jgi:hypothetical protein
MKVSVQSKWVRLAAFGVAALGLSAMTATAQLAFDDFNRANSSSLGTTSLGGFTWNENGEPNGEILLDTSTARFGSRGTGTDPAAVIGLSLQDIDVSVTINGFNPANNNYYGGLMYRLASTSALFADNSAGYRVAMDMAGFGTANTITLQWGNTILAQYTNGTSFAQGQDYTLRAVADGATQTIYLDGTPVITYVDGNGSHNVSGYTGIGTYYGNYNFDNFSVTTVPEPTTLTLVVCGLGGVVLLRKRIQRKS